MARLTGLDGAFLSLESPTTHLQIVGALVFDPSGVDGGLTFDRVRDVIAERLHLVPPFRQRMLDSPLGLQHPWMVDDPTFDIDYHLRRASLPRPGGRRELEALLGDLASHPLDRRRPLWEIYVVEGLEHGRIAVVPKLHHAIIDGVSGAEVMAAFFDLSADAGPRLHSRERADTPSTAPSSTAGGADGEMPSGAEGHLRDEMGRWLDALSSLPSQFEGLVRTAVRTWRAARSSTERNRELGGSLPPAPFEAPRTSINRAISPRRRVASVELDLGDVRRVAQILGGTANDVALALTAGALRTFFAGRGEQVDSSLVAMVPVSVRSESERGSLGNHLSAMLVSLASGVEDPAMRLSQIREGVQAAKEKTRAIGTGVFEGWAEAALPAMASRLSHLVTDLRLFDRLAPLFNVIMSNVRGPDFPLYLAGARMVAVYPLGPIIEGVAVNVTVFSYLDTLFVGVLGCWDLVPDVEVIAQGMRDSLSELVAEADRRHRPVPWWHAELPA